MGLIRSVDEISKELQKQKKLEQLERIEERKEKKKQQEQKENLKRYKNELELHLKTEFEQYFEKFGRYSKTYKGYTYYYLEDYCKKFDCDYHTLIDLHCTESEYEVVA